MSYLGKIYKVRCSAKDAHPDISGFNNKWKWDDWEELDIEFPPGISELSCKTLHFRIDHPLATEWDFYSDCGTAALGVISQRAKDLLGGYLQQSCNFMQTHVNDKPYYFLIGAANYVDCWDRNQSVYETYDSSDAVVVSFKKITSLSFFRDQLTDPMAFRIPQYHYLFLTESIKQMIEAADLKGFEFVDCDDMLWSHYA